jgi:hypothetical protein
LICTQSLSLYPKMLYKSMGIFDIILGTLDGILVPLHIIKSQYSLFLTVVKPKCFANLYPKLMFLPQNVQ